jgi:hypothetical protein
MATMDLQHAQVLIPAGVALVVVALTHFFTSARDRANKRREQRISYLIGVFRALCRANNHPRLYEVADEVEQAVADIQLFGTPEQVRLVQQFATDLGTKQHAEMNPLLESLRDSLRHEIGAARAKGHIVWLRIGRDPESKS